MRALSSARRGLRSIFRIAHFPAEFRNLLAQFVASLPILLAPCVLAFLCELRHFWRNHDFNFGFKIGNTVNSFPPIQPCGCRSGVQVVFVYFAIRFADRFKQKAQRCGNVQIIIERFFEVRFFNWALGVGRWALDVLPFRNFAQPHQPLINPVQRLACLAASPLRDARKWYRRRRNGYRPVRLTTPWTWRCIRYASPAGLVPMANPISRRRLLRPTPSTTRNRRCAPCRIRRALPGRS